jgi:hypothetical protein
MQGLNPYGYLVLQHMPIPELIRIAMDSQETFFSLVSQLPNVNFNSS